MAYNYIHGVLDTVPAKDGIYRYFGLYCNITFELKLKKQSKSETFKDKILSFNDC